MASKTVEVEAEVVGGEELSVQYKPASIDANFDDLEERVRKMVADYEGAVYDMSKDENVAAAKRDRAYLNGIVKQIDERRKAVKREYTKPLAAFEDRCKRIAGIAGGAADAIKAQLDEAEERRRDAAYAILKGYYEEVADLLAPVVPYERVHDEKWLNKSFGEVRAKRAVDERVGRLASDWESLKAQRGGMRHYEEAERELFRTLDLGAALAAARAADEEDARIAEMKAAIEPEPATPEPAPEPAPEPEPAPAREPRRALGPQPAPAPVPQPEPQRIIAPVPGEERKPWVVIIPSATRTDMLALAKLLAQTNVDGVIKQGSLALVAMREASNG